MSAPEIFFLMKHSVHKLKSHFPRLFFIFTLSFFSLFLLPKASANEYGLSLGYTFSAGILQSRAQTGSVRVSLTRPFGGSAQLFFAPPDSRWTYAIEQTLSPNLTTGAVDFQSLGLGFDLAFYEPTRLLAGGAVGVVSTRTFEPYWKGRLVVAEHTTAYLNPVNENLESIKIQNLGVVAGAGSRYKNGYAEAGLLIAPISLSNPAFFQFWILFTLGWTLKMAR